MKHIKTQNKTPSLKHGRGADRFDTRLPVEMGRIQGLTRNISATGIYFETETAPEPGSRVHFSVEVHVHGEKQKLVCDGEVVRVDHQNGMLGIAARLTGSFFSDAAEVIDIETGSLAGTH
ncbi:MAG: PilZ domain-containing protein [Gallionella sp.]|nr:PilZ domain-containing protein [Gallionella sp.]